MKETFYFSHDYNARSDAKIKRLLQKHGIAGYGAYWSIVEDLYQNANAMRTDYDCIAFDLRVKSEMIKSIINDFDLFIINGDMFGSLSVQRRLDERNERSRKARESASYRWNKTEPDANAMPMQSDSNAIKEKKRKKSKEKDININWKKDFNIYLSELKIAYQEIVKDEPLITEQRKFYPNIDILLTLEKSYVNFWATEAGWKKKKNARTVSIDWRATFINSLAQKMNHVYSNNNNNGTPKPSKNGSYD